VKYQAKENFSRTCSIERINTLHLCTTFLYFEVVVFFGAWQPWRSVTTERSHIWRNRLTLTPMNPAKLPPEAIKQAISALEAEGLIAASGTVIEKYQVKSDRYYCLGDPDKPLY
jgi:hypothetical protein